MKINITKKMIFTLTILLVSASAAFAQTATVKGVVYDSQTGETLPGAAIAIKGTLTGTSTGFDGTYKLEGVPAGNVELTCSFLGYSDMTVTIKNLQSGATATQDFFINPNSVNLDELIVIGYGVQKKSDKTGAVSQIKAADLNGGVLTDPVQALQGKSAGVIVSKKGGDPNSGFAIKIRGASGLDSNTQPLYVVDEVPGVDPTTIAPEDIESFNILKDAASTAIYGSRGANGVVIITTKSNASKEGAKRRSENGQLSFNASLSLDKVAKKLNLLDASQIRQYAEGNNLIGFVDGGSDTDWQDAIYRTGLSQNYNLNASGGNDKSTYYASVTHSDWKGVVEGSEKQRTIGRINFTHKAINDKLFISGTLSGTVEDNDYIGYDGWNNTNVLYTAFTHNPTDPIYNEDGTFAQINRGFKYCNPLATINEITNHRDAQRFLGNLKADYTIIDGLVLSGSYSYIADDNVNTYFVPNGALFETTTGEASKSYSNNYQNVLEITGSYSKTFKEKHNLNAVLGYSYQDYTYEGFTASGKNVQSNLIGPYNLGALSEVNVGDVSSYKGAWTLIGFFGRVQYNFDERYFGSASIRRDGSSKFGANNKWGWFPTVAAGWNIDNEKFMENISWIDQLKLRASYGISGNQEIGEYRSLVAYYPNGLAVNPETGEQVIVFTPAWNANPDLKWEETAEFNVGVDFAFLHSRLSGSLEFYNKTTTDMLGSYSVPVPPNLASTTYANSGKMINRGVELNVQGYIIDKPNLKWRSSLSASHNHQKIISLGEFTSSDGVRKDGYITGPGLIGNSNWVTGIIEGYEIGIFYVPELVLRSDGTPYLLDGEFVYKTSTGGYTTNIDQAQRYVAGSATPDFEIGFSNSFIIFKNWTVDINFRSMIGNDVYNATRMLLDYPGNLPNLNCLEDALTWAELGRTSGPAVCDYYVEDGSFLRLDYLALGYNFNMTRIKYIQTLRLYLASNNLFTITGYSGLDPETTIDGLSYGIDMYNVYPKTRSFTIGVNVTF